MDEIIERPADDRRRASSLAASRGQNFSKIGPPAIDFSRSFPRTSATIE